MERKYSTGFTLIEVIIGTALFGVLIFFIMYLTDQLSKWSTRSEIADRASEESRLLGLTLQTNLEGSRSFQSLSFHVPGTTLSCRGAGFCVEPDRDISGNPSVGNDLLYLAVRIPLPVELRLNAPYHGGSDLDVAAVGGGSLLSEVLNISDYLVLSRIVQSEIVQLTSSVPSTPTGILALSTTGALNSFLATDNSNGLPALESSYTRGDFLYKAKLLKIGLDSDSGEVRVQTIGSTAVPIVAARSVRHFAIHNRLTGSSAAPTGCASLIGPSPAFERTNWAAIQTSNCYSAVADLRVNYTVGQVDVAGLSLFPGAARSEAYTFKVNR